MLQVFPSSSRIYIESFWYFCFLVHCLTWFLAQLYGSSLILTRAENPVFHKRLLKRWSPLWKSKRLLKRWSSLWKSRGWRGIGFHVVPLVHTSDLPLFGVACLFVTPILLHRVTYGSFCSSPHPDVHLEMSLFQMPHAGFLLELGGDFSLVVAALPPRFPHVMDVDCFSCCRFLLILSPVSLLS